MEENKNLETFEETTAQEDNQHEEQPEEKMFTQEEVNQIIKKRLERQGKQYQAKEAEAASEAEKALESRTAELDSREKRLDCRAYLMDKKYPLDIIDIIDTSDVDAFKEKADRVMDMTGNKRVAPIASDDPDDFGDEYQEFINAKHIPKECSSIRHKYGWSSAGKQKSST